MPSLAYARDLSRAYASGKTCMGHPCTALNCSLATLLECQAACGPGLEDYLIKNKKCGYNQSPLQQVLGGGSNAIQETFKKNVTDPILGESNAFQNALRDFSKSIGTQVGPCTIPGTKVKVPFPCFLLVIFGILGALILIKH